MAVERVIITEAATCTDNSFTSFPALNEVDIFDALRMALSIKKVAAAKSSVITRLIAMRVYSTSSSFSMKFFP